MRSIKGLKLIQKYTGLHNTLPAKISTVWVSGIPVISSLLNQSFAETSLKHQLTPEERNGKQIYLFGTSASGRQITALLGDDVTEVPAGTLPCASCHGYDGKGRPEGGVFPTNITEETLMKPYGIVHPRGRKHPPYTDRSLRRAITQGIDPAGNKLSAAMPVYRLTHEEIDDLMAYLKRLGKEKDPGLTDNTLRLGVVLPGKEPVTEAGQTIKAVLLAYFNDLNEQGGIYNRKIELRFTTSGDNPATARTNILHLIENEEVFAINSAYIEGAEKEVDTLINEREIPLIGAVTNFPHVSFPLNRYIFYLFSGVKEQACAMADYAANNLATKNTRIAIVSTDSEVFLDITNALEEQCKNNGFNSFTTWKYSPHQSGTARLIGELRQKGIELVFLLGSGDEQKELLDEAQQLQRKPFIFIPGPLISREILNIPPGFKDKVFLSFPRGPSDMVRSTVMEYRTFAGKHKLSPRYLPIQVETYCSAKILTEGLKRAGKDVSREKLVAVLEGLYEFNTGLTPQITFGPNRRIGALGAYIASVDPEGKKIVGVSDWIKLQE